MIAKELTPIHFPEAREIQSECGLVGVYLRKKGVQEGLRPDGICYQADIDLQHRAEGSAGMIITDGVSLAKVKDLGEAKSVFKQGRELPYVANANLGMSHMRYPTAGGSNHIANIQPFELNGIWLGHHGNLTNAKEIEDKIGGVASSNEHPNSDSWVALNAIARAPGANLGESLVNAQREFEGGWAFITTDGRELVASRDPHGIRPLFIGHIGNGEDPKGYVLSVETCVFKNLGIKNFVEVLPGETIKVNEDGIKTIDLNPEKQASCIFEFVYMMHPDSTFLGELVHKVRRKAGELLWEEAPVQLEDGERLRVMPVPNSGRPAAAGFAAEARKILGDRVDLEEGLLTNAYYGRNFIKPSSGRDARKKFYTVDYLIQGQTIALVDDSIVRGDTSKALIEMLYEAGAKKVHARVASPEIKNPCYWGVAFGKYEELITHKKPTIKEREEFLGVDSLSYLSIENLIKAVGVDKNKLCTFCFDGNGPNLPKGVVPLTENA